MTCGISDEKSLGIKNLLTFNRTRIIFSTRLRLNPFWGQAKACWVKRSAKKATTMNSTTTDNLCFNSLGVGPVSVVACPPKASNPGSDPPIRPGFSFSINKPTVSFSHQCVSNGSYLNKVSRTPNASYYFLTKIIYIISFIYNLDSRLET
jgi:hypothetical protein